MVMHEERTSLFYYFFSYKSLSFSFQEEKSHAIIKNEVLNMKKCKRCGTLLDENATVCTVCGIDHPCKDEPKKTEYDLTLAFDPMEQNTDLYRLKSRKKLLVFAWLLGFLGVPYFYMGYEKKGLLTLIISVLCMGGAFLGLFLGLNSILYGAIALGVILLIINIGFGVFFVRHASYKDVHGEYLR